MTPRERTMLACLVWTCIGGSIAHLLLGLGELRALVFAQFAAFLVYLQERDLRIEAQSALMEVRETNAQYADDIGDLFKRSESVALDLTFGTKGKGKCN